jgi:two-component system, NtrC family, response regulator AtoC
MHADTGVTEPQQDKRETIRVLAVDDERPTRLLMERELPRAGFRVEVAESGEEALAAIRTQDFDVILLDLRMPGVGGMEALRRIRESEATAEVVILTGHPDVDTAIAAMKLGAYDYLTKPFKLTELEQVIRRAAERKRLQQENQALRRMVALREPLPLIVGGSRAVADLLATVRRIAPTDANILIMGPSGTGKGLVARVIHESSARTAGPFLVINCSAFQDQLLESELFGHEKGAFTGAVASKQGLFEVAEGGTLVLDEVGEMSPAMQAKLLQVLDTHEMRRVGGTRVHRLDVRVIAATNRDLPEAIRAGRFREDLYYRLNVVTLTLPPLRERKEDIVPLIEHFLSRFGSAGYGPRRFAPEALKVLVDYPWPGNVRELANTIERLLILAPRDVIGPDDLPPNIRSAQEAVGTPGSLADMERLHILRVLKDTQGRKAQAARILGVDVKTLNKKIKDYQIALP